MASSTVVQVPSIILPTVWAVGTETETIDDLVEHTSIEFPVEFLQEKQIHIVATEVALGAVVPGPLWMWVELSPYPSAVSNYWPTGLPTSTAYWAAIGGGGGAQVPTVPYIEVSVLAGVPGTSVHPILLPWATHSMWARLVMQMPVNATPLVGYWVIQAMISAKTG